METGARGTCHVATTQDPRTRKGCSALRSCDMKLGQEARKEAMCKWVTHTTVSLWCPGNMCTASNPTNQVPPTNLHVISVSNFNIISSSVLLVRRRQRQDRYLEWLYFGRPEPGDWNCIRSFMWMAGTYFQFYLLPPRLHVSRKLETGAQLGLKPRHSWTVA